MEKTVRINKALADAGICSRRRADELIAAGRVSVNGEPVTSPGLQVTPGTDKLEVDGKPVQPIAQAPCYLLLNKPVRVVSTAYDPEGRTTVLDLVPAKWKARRLYPAGRLDFFSEGLVLLTDDGELTNRVVHPRHHMPRVYHVLIRGGVSDRALEVMRKGMTLAEGEKLAPVEIRVLPGQVHDLSGVSRNAGPPAGQRGTLLEMTLHQGLNRQIRRMCEYFGYKVVTLKRVRIMNLHLDGLEEGKYREIRPEERKELEEMLSSEKSEKRTGGSHERIIHKKNERAGRKAPGSVQGLLSGRQGDHVQRGVRRPVRHSERTGERNRDRSGRQSNR